MIYKPAFARVFGALVGLFAAQAVQAVDGDAASAPSGNAARLQRLVEVSDKPWTQLLSQNALDLKPGEPYRLTFWAKASAPMVLRVLIKIDQAPWTGLQEQRLELGAEWQLQEVFLKSDIAEPGHTRLEFRYGGTEPGDLWVADVQLRPEGSNDAENIIQNGRFEDQLVHWYIEGQRPEVFSIQVEPVQSAGSAP